MAFETAPFFPHRRNKDGSFNSIGQVLCNRRVAHDRRGAEGTR